MFKNIDSKTILGWLTGFLIAGLLAIVGVVGMYIWLHADQEISVVNSDWGQFGDYVGGLLNPLFGFLAFMGLLFTIALQARELEEARTAAKSQQESLKAAREANETTQDFQYNQILFMQRQNEQADREQKLSDLDKAIRMQADIVDSEIDKPYFEIMTYPKTERSFRQGIRQFRFKAEGLPCAKGFEHREFDEEIKSHAVYMCTFLYRLGILLAEYDAILAPDGSTKSYHYTNTWRFL